MIMGLRSYNFNIVKYNLLAVFLYVNLNFTCFIRVAHVTHLPGFVNQYMDYMNIWDIQYVKKKGNVQHSTEIMEIEEIEDRL